MKDKLDALINVLRDELQHYGELLAQLEQQQDHLMSRASDHLIQSAAALQDCTDRVQTARSARLYCQADLARSLQLPGSALFADLSDRLPDSHRPLVRALVEENNDLLKRVRERAHQNHLMMAHSLQLMQHFIHTLFPGCRPQLYGEKGHMLPAEFAQQPLFNSVG